MTCTKVHGVHRPRVITALLSMGWRRGSPWWVSRHMRAVRLAKRTTLDVPELRTRLFLGWECGFGGAARCCKIMFPHVRELGVVVGAGLVGIRAQIS
nr:MAG: hypothetical protein DIU78_03895 [Pseudomonadota bacterium]